MRNKKRFTYLLISGVSVLALLSCQTSSERPDMLSVTRQNADSCDSPDAPINCSFASMPSKLTNTMTITNEKEPGQKLIISGIILREDGYTPYPNVIIYAYHTDSRGYYSKSGTETGAQRWHGRLHGWCKSDDKGQYEINTIRPARYPGNTMPAHIHAAIRKEDGKMYWISDFVFNDDSLVNTDYLSSLSNVGGTGVIDIKRNSDNSWTGVRDIVLTE